MKHRLVVVLFAVVSLLVTPAAFSSAASAATVLPAGFVLESVASPVSSGLQNIQYVPPSSGVEGGTFGAVKTGQIVWMQDGGTSRVLGTLPTVYSAGENGLSAVTPAQDYATTGRIYVLFTRAASPQSYGMLEAFHVDSVKHPTTLVWEGAVIDGRNSSWWISSGNHELGDVLVAKDGTLFFNEGDGTNPNSAAQSALLAQDYNNPHGKIMHVTPDGKGVSTNPSYDSANPTSWKSRVYASGVRNGFRLFNDPTTGKMASSIVGWNSFDEVSYIQAGGNYGWPCWEGTSHTPTYSSYPECIALYAKTNRAPALWVEPHNGAGMSLTGGAVYTGTSYPAAYRNKTFIGDYARGELWTYGSDGTKLTTAPSRMGTDVGTPTAVRTCQNGDICWADFATGTVQRLRYGLANHAPRADFTSSVNPSTKTVAFDASLSSDPDGDALTYAWAFGDGTTGSGIRVSHTYVGNGPYAVTLTVKDSVGNEGNTTVSTYAADAQPTIKLTVPTKANFAVGDTVSLSAAAADAEDGALPAASIKWSASLQHCPFNGACHIHPLLDSTGATFSTTFPDHGGDTRVLITVTSPPDRTGKTASATYTAIPRLRTVAIAAPPGVTGSIEADNVNKAQVVENASVQLSVPTTSTYNVFQKWNDGTTTALRTLKVPANDVTLTPVYATRINLYYAGTPTAQKILGAPTAAETSVGVGRQRNYQYGSLFWTQAQGVHMVKGAILSKFKDLGGAASFGFPTSDELATPDGVGRYNTFNNDNSIYWTPTTNAHEIRGGIRSKWNSLGAERSRLGYPTSDEFSITGGRRSNFQHGFITWSQKDGSMQVTYT